MTKDLKDLKAIGQATGRYLLNVVVEVCLVFGWLASMFFLLQISVVIRNKYIYIYNKYVIINTLYIEIDSIFWGVRREIHITLREIMWIGIHRGEITAASRSCRMLVIMNVFGDFGTF